ncbi:MAG: class A beta-lactamase-related serine hydrolase [Desulfobacterota bacterium]|nr:class A beta-lactamase-related serine hydrolase [Thermodesulfobacteriota bacterium]
MFRNSIGLLAGSKILYCVVLLGCTIPHPIPQPGQKPAPHIIANENASFFPELIASYSPICKTVIEHADQYEVQILYTHIERDAAGKPLCTEYSFRVNPGAYFNPASLVKLPVACLALQKLRELNIPGLDINTPLVVGAAYACQRSVSRDFTAPNGLPTIGHYIKKALIVSDNDAYNRLYEFLGQQYINTTLTRMGYPYARIIRRFSRCTAEQNRYTNPFTFFTPEGAVLYRQPLLVNTDILTNPLGAVRKGRGYRDEHGRIIPEPFNYETHNYLCLRDVHRMLQSIIFPELFPESMRFHLAPEDYRFLRFCLSSLPRESGIPVFSNPATYPDNYKKYFIFGDAPNGVIDTGSIKIFNVVGRTDGFLADCAYITCLDEHIEFFLSAVMYVNANGIIKDGVYEYKELGIPFFAHLGRALLAHEKNMRTR